MILGLDVSHWQSRMNWDKVARYGGKFMFAKASEIYAGRVYKDDQYIANIQNARKAGLITGAYHFFRPSSPLTAQCRIFREQWDKAPADLPPVIDAETHDGMSAKAVKNAFEHFYKDIANAWGRKPILYSRDGLVKAWGLMDYIADPLYYWKALYASKLTGYPAKFWQFSETFRVPGIDRNLDGDYFMGEIDELQSLVSGDIITPELPTGQPKFGKVVVGLLNVRVEPDVDSRAIGQLRKGAKVEILSIQNERWAEIEGGFVALYGAAGVFVQIEQ